MAYYSDDFYDKAWPNYNSFINELTQLSKKYGVVVSGHFDITLDPSEFKNIRYSNDISSSDINAYGYWESEDNC
jgi:hypothetical protein